MRSSTVIDYDIGSQEANRKRKRNSGASERYRTRKQEEIYKIETLKQQVK